MNALLKTIPYIFIYMLGLTLASIMSAGDDTVLVIYYVIAAIWLTLSYGNCKDRYVMEQAIRKADIRYLAAFSILASACAWFISDIFYNLQPAYVDSLADSQDYSTITLIAAVFLAPVCEELLFRGIIYYNTSLTTSPSIGIGLSAGLFALCHGNILQGTYTFLLGIALGIIIHKTKNVKYTIMCHIIFNGFAILFSYLNIELPLILDIILVVIILTSCIYTEYKALRRSE